MKRILVDQSRRNAARRRRRMVARQGLAGHWAERPTPMFTSGKITYEVGGYVEVDHITVLNRALAQIPDAHRYGTDILIRSDSAGCTYGFLAHIRSLREQGINTFFSVGVAIGETVRDAIRIAIDHPEHWVPALVTAFDRLAALPQPIT